MKYIFRPSAEKQFAKLDSEIQSSIVHKLRFYIANEHPLMFAKRLKHFHSGQYRFRIGDYRVTFDVTKDTIVVLSVGHRRDIYK